MSQLTAYLGHSHHFYFTNPGWYADGRRLLFSSDRINRTNLFSIDLETHEILQLTDLEPVPPPRENHFLNACVNPLRDEAYFTHDLDVRAIDLQTLEQRTLCELPDGFCRANLSCTANGRYVCTSVYEDLTDRFRVELLHGAIGHHEYFHANPLSKIFRISVAGGAPELVHEEKNWISHTNTSPTQPNLLTFCHEGPWEKVPQRMWGLDLGSGDVWKIRPQKERELVGHEYWYADGLRIGYHGRGCDGRHFIGRLRFDNSEPFEISFPYLTGHTHSNDHQRIVGDAGEVVRLWEWNGENYDPPRVLCEHRGSGHVQQTHVHPRFTPDGNQVLFTSDTSGYGNIYLVDLPDDVGCLPEVPED